MLEIRNLAVSYGAIEAVRSIDLIARPGEITALVGANGAGKSSIMKAISGVTRITAGSIKIDGEEISHLPSHQRARMGLAHAMEGRRIFHQHTVEENLVTAWHFRNASGDLNTATDEVYSKFPILADRRRAQAGTLSGGQQQMLILSMATLHSPRFVLLDEPSLGIAPIIVEQIFEFIQSYVEEGKRVVLLSEQMASLALRVSHYTYVIKHGQVALKGSRAELENEGIADSLASAYLGIDNAGKTLGI